jgi:hypothetical protein
MCGDVSVLLTGSFREYPFSILLEIFLRRQETGLLEISSAEESGYFYIKNGKVKDGQIGESKGVAAVKLAGKFNDGTFRFKPLEPTDYARIVWQRSFGPTGASFGSPSLTSSAVANKLSQFRFDPAVARRVLNDLDSLAQLTLRQFLLYASTAFHSLQRIGLFVWGLTVAWAVAAFQLWRRARVGARLWQVLMKVLTALLEDKRRRERQLKYSHPQKSSFQLPAIPGARAVALRHGIEHNIIFVLTLTILFAMSGLLLHQLIFENQPSIDTDVTADEHADISVNTAHSRVKPKRRHRKRPPTHKTRDKATDDPN